MDDNALHISEKIMFNTQILRILDMLISTQNLRFTRTLNPTCEYT